MAPCLHIRRRYPPLGRMSGLVVSSGLARVLHLCKVPLGILCGRLTCLVVSLWLPTPWGCREVAQWGSIHTHRHTVCVRHMRARDHDNSMTCRFTGLTLGHCGGHPLRTECPKCLHGLLRASGHLFSQKPVGTFSDFLFLVWSPCTREGDEVTKRDSSPFLVCFVF